MMVRTYTAAYLTSQVTITDQKLISLIQLFAALLHGPRFETFVRAIQTSGGAK
jgi:hypothetical protein